MVYIPRTIREIFPEPVPPYRALESTREMQSNQHDPINPSHYKTASGLEAIDVIEAFDLDFYLANATKYILRSGKKGPQEEDLKKAIWYLQRKLTRLQGRS